MNITAFLIVSAAIASFIALYGCYLVWRSHNFKISNDFVIENNQREQEHLNKILQIISVKKHIHVTKNQFGFDISASDFDPQIRPLPIPTPTNLIAPTVIPPAISDKNMIEGKLVYSDKHFDRIEIRSMG